MKLVRFAADNERRGQATADPARVFVATALAFAPITLALHTTCVATMLPAGHDAKTPLPQTASANVNAGFCGEDPKKYIRRSRAVATIREGKITTVTKLTPDGKVAPVVTGAAVAAAPGKK